MASGPSTSATSSWPASMNATTSSAREGAGGPFSGVSTVWPRSSSSLYGPERDASSRRIGLELAARRAHRPSNVNRDDFSFNKCYPCSRLTLSPIFSVAPLRSRMASRKHQSPQLRSFKGKWSQKLAR